MAPKHDGTDPALAHTPVPLEGDGSELVGMIVDGRYRLDSTVGRGGMGLVYRATHLGMRRQVAVKILHPSLAASPDVRSRFEREALAVGKVDHPNCVATYDVGRLPDGSLYLAMELLDGKSLADILEHEGQLAPGRALHILGHVLRGLSSIHNAGLIHRDIKPENIFLIRHGDDLDFAKILDFGIAKPMSGELSDDGVRLTQAGMAFGTPIYMAPEQALGNPMDGRADLYAAAVIGYEMLCGQPPFYSEDKLEVMSMHTAKPVPLMRNRLIKGGKPVPSSIEKLILRGLTKKPGDRYPTAEVFIAAVESALHTPDGGQTDVSIERPTGRDTGSQPLVDDHGELNIGIDDAIEEALGVAPVAKKKDKKRATEPPPVGSALRDSTGRIATTVGVPPPAAALAATANEPRARRQGGVGIGLPFTGPSGEPIFGLTPEQRLEQSKPSRKKWFVYGGVLAVAIAIGVAIAIATAPGGKKIDRNTPAGQAMEALDHGDYVGAIRILEAKKDEIAGDPDAQLVLGHAYSAKNEPPLAISAYRRALALAPELESDKDFRANMRAMAGAKDPDVVQNAFDLWVGHTKDKDAPDLLMKALQSADVERRHAALRVMDRYKLGTTLHRIQAYSLDLQEVKTCEGRAEAVAKLRAIGDPAAIPALERAITARGKTGAWRGKAINGCLIEDATQAIGYLKSLQSGKKK
jgi:eukaryotic-like serine/threonine-protein kinase